MYKKRNHLIFWMIVTIALLIPTIMHPRLHNILVTLICFIKCILLAAAPKCDDEEREQKINTGLLRHTICLLICAAILWYIGSILLDGFFPYHAPYEYKADMRTFKSRSSKTDYDYTHFPDEIPGSARKVQWVCVPSMMQGSHEELLFFYADADYLSAVYNTYAPQAELYVYDEDALWWKEYTGGEEEYDEYDEYADDTRKDCPDFPIFEGMMGRNEDEYAETIVLITNYTDDTHGGHCSGIYINETKGYICFWAI